jgi:hypothetical protein
MEKRNKEVFFWNLISIAIIAALWIIYTHYSKTLIIGFHFTDDHDFFRITNSIEKAGFWDTFKNVISQDLTIRFRPFYYAHRVFIVYLFRVNFIAYSLYNVALAIITSSTLFLTARKLKFNSIISLLFSFVILIGPQMEIWYRKGPAETIGFTIYTLSIYFLIKGVKEKRSGILWIAVFILALSTLCKESFVATIPVFLFVLVSLSLNKVSLLEIKKEFINKSPYITVLSLLLIIEVYCVLAYVGINKIGYAGVDNGTNIKSVIKVGIHFFTNSYILVFLSSIYLFLLIIFNVRKKSKPNYVFYFGILYIILLWSPQFFIYNKTFITFRYLLPSTIGIGVLYLIITYEIRQIKFKPILVNGVFQSAICILLFINLRLNSLPAAEKFSEETVNTNILLETLKSNAQKDDSIAIILSASYNYEWGHSIKKYLNYYGYQKISFLTDVNFISYNSFDKFLAKEFNKKFNNELEVNEMETMNKDHIIILPFPKNEVIQKTFLEEATYIKKIGPFIYLKNE